MAQASALPISFMQACDAKPAPAQPDRWSELMACAQTGHGGAYNRLLGEVAVWLRSYYATRLPPSQIDDVVQETLMAVHAKRHTYEPGRPFRAWLAGIARYKWIDRLRSIGRAPSDPLDDNEISIGDHGASVTNRVDIERLLSRLKPGQARAIQLVKLEGYSVEEAALATGQSVPLVKVNIHRGIARLAALIEVDIEQA